MNDPHFLTNLIKQFKYYRLLGEQTFDQLTDEELFWRPNEASNSIAIIAKHIAGNSLSRWTDFLKSDGEKDWRNREQEFETDWTSRQDMLEYWDKGWSALFNALEPLSNDDLETIVYIRNTGHTVIEAINRQLAHYAYHVGQIVYLGRLIKGDQWLSLSIPKGSSAAFNQKKFESSKSRGHFSDQFLKDKN